MATPAIDDCTGLWRRSLLVNADGSEDATVGVRWLQGRTAYVDSRGFAGRLRQRGAVFEWERIVDLEVPGPHPDAGVMHWDGEVLVETGVHEDYVEHWVRASPGAAPDAVFLHAPDRGEALLLRVGEEFGWAGGGTVVIGSVGGAQWQALEIEWSDDEVQASGHRWIIREKEA